MFICHVQREDGKLPDKHTIKIKISGDGARMTKLTNYVILSFCILNGSEDVLSAKATNTIAVMSGSESYESLKISFADAWKEINGIVTDGEVELKPGEKVPVEVFLGGDYKVCTIKIPVFMHL